MLFCPWHFKRSRTGVSKLRPWGASVLQSLAPACLNTPVWKFLVCVKEWVSACNMGVSRSGKWGSLCANWSVTALLFVFTTNSETGGSAHIAKVSTIVMCQRQVTIWWPGAYVETCNSRNTRMCWETIMLRMRESTLQNTALRIMSECDVETCLVLFYFLLATNNPNFSLCCLQHPRQRIGATQQGELYKHIRLQVVTMFQLFVKFDLNSP